MAAAPADNDTDMDGGAATTGGKGDEKPAAAEDKVPQKKKRSPNRLIVDDVTEVVQGDGDNSCVLLSPAKMEGMLILYEIHTI